MEKTYIYTGIESPDESFLGRKFTDEENNRVGVIVDYSDLTITVYYKSRFKIFVDKIIKSFKSWIK